MFKVIMATVAGTTAVLSLTAWLMLNTLLGAFGLVATSVERLADLTQASAVVDKMKTRNQSKRQQASKKFVKRSGAKVASAALAASTIGTIAVVSTVVVFEIDDYCSEQESLLKEKNLLFGTSEAFDYDACIEQARSDSREILLEAKNSAQQNFDEQWSEAKSFSELQWQQLRLSAQEFLNLAQELSNELWDDLEELARNF